MEVVELARENLNPDLELLGILLNLADMRTVHSREALASLKERFGEHVFDTVIRASIAYAESAERARSILDHRPDLGADYTALAAELLERLPELAGRPRARRRARSELPDVGPLGLERGPQQLRPALDLLRQRARRRRPSARRSTTPARSGRPPRSSLRAPPARGSAGELERAREQVRAALLVEPVLQAAREQVPVPACEPDGQQRGVGDVEDGLSIGTSAGSAARAARVRTGSLGHDRQRLQAARRVEPRDLAVGDRSRSPRAARRRRCRGGPRWRVASASRSASSSNRWSAAISPATTAAALEPSPPESGISERIVKVKSSAGCRRSKARTQQVVAAPRDGQVGVHREAARLGDLELQPERDRRRHAVESGPEVG